jgi:hypothetical protein
MKRLCIITLVILCLGFCPEIYAEIRNGYEEEIIKVEKWLNQLYEIANGPLNELQREKMNKKLKEAHATVDKLRENHGNTQELIEMFRMIDPALYDEINTIQDNEGNETDVYIKVVDDLGPDLRGATNVKHSDDNPNVYSSEYGDYTVSIKLITTGPIWPLWILVHELGHVRYQVPHLVEYTTFHKKVYQDQHFAGVQGHHPNDPSYYSVQETSKAFKKSWNEYNREMKWIAKDKSRKMLASTRED